MNEKGFAELNEEQERRWHGDLKLDRWVLGLLFAAVLGFSGYSFKEFSRKVDGLNRSVNQLNITVSVVGEQMKDIRDLKTGQERLSERVMVLELQMAELRGRRSGEGSE